MSLLSFAVPERKRRRVFLAALLVVFLSGLFLVDRPEADAVRLRVGTFRCDVTPPAGEPLVWDTPLTGVAEPLWAKGIVLDDGRHRYVICAVDWCEICNESDLAFRKSLARGARTDVSRVIVHSVHQHAAPYADAGAHRILDGAPKPPLRLSDRFLVEVSERLEKGAASALLSLQPADRIGTGRAAVERVASTRRLKDSSGNITVRFSSGGKSPELAEAPEGDIDPYLRTVTFGRGEIPLVRLHYYATHPQTFCCDGIASSDFVGLARESREKREGVFQIYFTGAAGDVTVGKYNDGSPEAAAGLKERLEKAMEESSRSTAWSPLARPVWRTAQLVLPLRTDEGHRPSDGLTRANDPDASPGERVYRGAILAAFGARIKQPLQVSSLQIGTVRLLHLPGEPMLEFQRFAQQVTPDDFVAVAGYVDCGPGYLCTDDAFREGGYEPTDANGGPGTEALVKAAIRKVAGNTAGRTKD
jgi:hypothetical protein